MTALLEVLESSRAEFVAAALSVGEARAKTSPGPGQWCVLECVEHIVHSETRFLGWLQKPDGTVAPPPDKTREAVLPERMAGRTVKVEAPEPVRPVGKFATLSEALREFEAARARSLQFVEQNGDKLYSMGATHRFFGTLNGCELILLIAAHARRHAAQMREIREALG